MRITLVFAILLSILVAFFAINNNYNIELNLFFTNVTLPLPVLMLLTFAAGVLITLLLNIPSWWRSKKERKGLHKQITELSQQVNAQPPKPEEGIVDDFVKDVDEE